MAFAPSSPAIWIDRVMAFTMKVLYASSAVRIGHREHGKIERIIAGARKDLHALRFAKGTEHNVCLGR